MFAKIALFPTCSSINRWCHF